MNWSLVGALVGIVIVSFIGGWLQGYQTARREKDVWR